MIHLIYLYKYDNFFLEVKLERKDLKGEIDHSICL